MSSFPSPKPTYGGDVSARHSLTRIVFGEFAATALLLVVALLSGLARKELGSMEGALLGSAAFGLGTALVIMTFAPLSKAQANPLVSVLASIGGGQRWSDTAMRVLAQSLGAMAVRGAAMLISSTASAVEPRPFADGFAAFGFLLVAIGVAGTRDARVPIALGAFAAASYWMTGRATLGNPLLSIALGPTNGFWSVAALDASATAGGSLLAGTVGWLLFPMPGESFGLLVYAPKASA